MLLRIVSYYFCAEYDLESNKIAPIIKYMKGWDLNKIKTIAKEKNGN